MKKEHRRRFLDSTCQTVLIALMCFVVGIYWGGNHIDFKQNGQFILYLIAVIVMGMLVLLYYNYQMARIKINPSVRRKQLTYWYWGMVGVLFLMYMYRHYSIFLASYEKNPFGINQEQYVILVNLVIVVVIGSVFYLILFQRYSIKNIGKDGIELEREIEVQVLQTNTDIISKIGQQLGALDEVVHQLDLMGYVDPYLDYESYINLMERILYPITEKLDEVYISVFSKKQYEDYMYKDKGYTTAMVKKASYNLKDCGIIKVEDSIHIKYKLANFQNYKEQEVYIIIQLGSLYDIKVGELIYGYIKCFEALYSKYL